MILRIWLILIGFLWGMPFFAGAQDSVTQLPNRLVISSLKDPSRKVTLDSNGVISIACISRTDSLVREQQRQLSGELIGFTDTSLVLLVDQESLLTYYRNGTMEQFYYWKSEDSTEMHIDTIQLQHIYSIRFDTGRFRQVVGMMQSTSYTFMMGNIVVLVASFLTPGKYTPTIYGRNLLLTTGVGLAAGSASFIFYPKIFRVANQPGKHKKIKWRVEVI